AMVVAGFMVATAFVSMWVSNTATAVMMLPIGVSVLLLVAKLREEGPPAGAGAAEEVDVEPTEAKEQLIESSFGTDLMLGIAYAARLGSLATTSGTPPSTLLVGCLSANPDISMGFGQWMVVGLPRAVVVLAICGFLRTTVLYKPEITQTPGGRELMNEE